MDVQKKQHVFQYFVSVDIYSSQNLGTLKSMQNIHPRKMFVSRNTKNQWLLSKFGTSLQEGFNLQPTPLEINGWFTGSPKNPTEKLKSGNSFKQKKLHLHDDFGFKICQFSRVHS